jgi:hypothetical protein
VIDQQQWLQGYFGVLQICLTHNYGFAGLHIDTGAGFGDKDNVEAWLRWLNNRFAKVESISTSQAAPP